MQRVKAGERQEGTSEMTEKDIENLNYGGQVLLTWDNYKLRYVGYQQQFLLSMKQ